MKIEEKIPPKNKTHWSKFVKPIIPLTRPENNELDALEYIDHKCQNTPRDTTSGKYVIKIPRYNSGTPEDWIISGLPKYKWMERVLKGDAKAEFLEKVNLVAR